MEILQLPPDALKTPPNIRSLLIGCSSCGKSSFIAEIIKHKDTVFPHPGYAKFIYCSPNLNSDDFVTPEDAAFQERLESYAAPSQIVFMDHILTYDELTEQAQSTEGRIMLFVDDYSQEAFDNPIMYQLFTRLSSHKRTDTMISLHVGAGASKTAGKWFSLVKQNCNFLVIFRNLANRASIDHLSQSIFPRGENFLQRCLDATTKILGCYAYIVVDANIANPLNQDYGVRGNIFENNDIPMLLYKTPRMYSKKH